MTRADDRLAAAAERELPQARQDLETLVRIPSVSADPAARSQVQASADEVARLFRSTGVPDVQVVQADDGHPAVLARSPAPTGTATVLLYAHHDVQPPGDPQDWASDPFEPVERDGRLYGRGAADDKAGIAVHLAAVRALLAQDDGPGLGLTVLVEGEEEIGSPTLPELLRQHADRLAVDALVLADSINWRVGVPALTTSLRGGTSVVVEVRTLQQAVHNGLYGGPVPDALTVLARLLSTLHDDEGRVAVPGLRHGEADMEVDEADFRREAGMLDGVRLLGRGSLASRLWSRPAISVVGIDAPPVAGSAMNLVPQARAKVALRVAPGDDAATARDALVEHLRRNAPWGAHVTVTAGKAVQPFAASTDGPAYAAARHAFEEAWGVPPVAIGVGGSIDFVTTFARRFPQAEVLITGVEDPDTRAHGPNESVHLADFERAVVAETLLLGRLAHYVSPQPR
ncbi:MAG: dipeptidase [Actinomycetes bacterium]